jgi:hypothetical protein
MEMGDARLNAWLKISAEAAAEVRRTMAEFGMTPSSRAGLKTPKIEGVGPALGRPRAGLPAMGRR